VIQPLLVRADENFNSLRLSFAVLEPGDGAVIEIVYDGPLAAKVEIDGVCVGSHRPTVLPSDGRSFSTRPKQFFEPYIGLIAVTLMACIVMPIIYGVIWIVQRLFSQRTGLVLFLVFLSCLVAFLIANFIRDQYSRATRKYVPPDIRPD
jgi:hypothetical protein